MQNLKIYILYLSLVSIGVHATTISKKAPENISAFVFSQNQEGKKHVERLQILLEEVLKSRQDYEFTNLNSLLGSKKSTEAQKAMLKAKKAFDTGLAEYRLLNLIKAHQSFSRALNLYNKSLPYLSSLSDLAKTNLFLGATEHLSGNAAKSKAYYLEAYTLDQDIYNKKRWLVKSQEKHFTDLIKSFNDSRKKFGPREITISSEPDYAGVSIDGKFINATPALKHKLDRGTHILQASYPGYSNYAAPITVTEHSYPNIYINLKPTPKFKKFKLLTDGLLLNVAQPKINAAEELKVDNVIWLALSANKSALTAHASFNNNTSKKPQKVKTSTFRVFMPDNPAFETEFENWIAQVIQDNAPNSKQAHALHKTWRPD